MSGQTDFPKVGTVLLVDPAFVLPMPGQPREDFNFQELTELADSIRNGGQQHAGTMFPLEVRKDGNMYFQLKSGERRLRACRMIKRFFRGEIVESKGPVEDFVDAVVANCHGKDLLPLEMARSLARIKTEKGSTDKELSALFGKSPAWAGQYLSLLRLHSRVQYLMSPSVDEDKRIKFWVGVSLVPLSAEDQVELAEKISEDGLSSTQARTLIKERVRRVEEKSGRRLTKRTPNRDFNILRGFVRRTDTDAQAILSLSNGRFREMFSNRSREEQRRTLALVRRCIEHLIEIEECVESSCPGVDKTPPSWTLGVNSGT